ncbi:hypothetical protein NB037_12165 [Rathayibacter sp. ZW T2_19]|uniref:Peptidoglycan binding domain-containing protein n=1 Tax=Rathayibacter rubneri TaxID=2950106 RepID=A0A9X2E0I5_9MICO|nr:hypothetical protein [Rathayibacter rubneri]MCM6763173.1 hypothetical protein [Rathayibacter rubneri]
MTAAQAATRAGIAALLAFALLAAGATTALLLLAPTVPASLRSADDPLTVPVSYQDFADPRPVELTFTRAPDISVVARASGVVTAYSCRSGAALESGGSPLSIDGAPLLALATSTPLWRDLAIGDSGDDVRALQRELVRLGAPLVADGTLGAGSIQAIERRLEKASGRAEQLSTVPLARLLWLPGPSVVAASCEVSLGGRVDGAVPIAVVAGSVASASIVAVPSGMLDGERRLVVDDAVLVPTPEGRIDSEQELHAFASTPSARTALATEGGSTVPGQYVLAAPVRVGIVPPSALAGADGGTACVLTDGGPVRVHVVDSELGRSSVEFPSGSEPALVAADPPADLDCA